MRVHRPVALVAAFSASGDERTVPVARRGAIGLPLKFPERALHSCTGQFNIQERLGRQMNN